MADRNHVMAGMFDIDAIDRAADPIVQIHKTFAARRRLADISEPVAAGRPAGEKCDAVHPLPLSEMLLGEGRLLHHRRRLRKTGIPDRLRSLMRTLEAARNPDSLARQDLRHRLENMAVAGVAGDVLLTVDVAAVAAHRRVAHPPPPCRRNCRLVDIGHQENPSIMLVSYVTAPNVSSHFDV